MFAGSLVDAVGFKSLQQEQVDPKESPYFDSLCRSFLLGVGAGALVETVHMVSKLVETPDFAGGWGAAAMRPSYSAADPTADWNSATEHAVTSYSVWPRQQLGTLLARLSNGVAYRDQPQPNRVVSAASEAVVAPFTTSPQ